MREGGRDFARLTAVLNGFLPSCMPFINSGFEVYERQPMNLGFDIIRPGRFALPPSDAYYGKLAYFDRVALHWCNRGGKDMVDLLARVGRIRARFLADYSASRTDWQSQHPDIPDACYPLPMALPQKFSLSWHAFKVTGAPELTPVEDIEMELEQRRVRDEQVRLMEANLQRECREFVEQYVLGFRGEVAEFCDQVITAKGQVHGKTLNAIRDRIDRFHAMNVFGDADAATKLTRLKQQIAGLSGQDLAQQPDVAQKLSRACQALKDHILNSENVSVPTGRLKRRVVLD